MNKTKLKIAVSLIGSVLLLFCLSSCAFSEITGTSEVFPKITKIENSDWPSYSAKITWEYHTHEGRVKNLKNFKVYICYNQIIPEDNTKSAKNIQKIDISDLVKDLEPNTEHSYTILFTEACDLYYCISIEDKAHMTKQTSEWTKQSLLN